MKKLLPLLLAMNLATAAAAEVNVAAPFLQNGAGARSKAMGECYSALAEGPFGLWYNPAGLGGLAGWNVGFQHETTAGLLRQEVLAGSFRVGPGGLGLFFQGVDYGQLDARDSANVKTGQTVNPTDSLLLVGYGLPLGERWRVGAGLGIFAENLGEKKLGGGLLDLGGAWDWNPDGSLALVAKNLGAGPDGYRLPSLLQVAGTQTWFSRVLRLTLEADLPLGPNAAALGFGLEYQPWKWLAVRTGYKGPVANPALEGLALGAGFNVWDLSLDLAVMGRGDFGGQSTLSLTYAFRPAAAEPKEEKPAAGDENLKFQGSDLKQAAYHYQAGQEYERYGQWVDAIVEYKAALNIRPEYPEAQKALAQAREKMRAQTEEAEGGRKGSGADAPESLQVTIRKYYERGLNAYKGRDYSTAIKQLQLVLELTTQHRQATELLEKAKDALDRELGNLRGQAQKAKAQGDLASEVEAYRKMLALDPENREVKAGLDSAERRIPETVDALYKKGVDLYAKGDWRAALKTFENLLRLQPDHVKAKDAVANIKEKLIQTGQ